MLPPNFDNHPDLDAKLANVTYSNKIPRIIWVAVVNASEELPGHLYELFKRNKDWTVRVAGNQEKDVFINRVFAGTRVQWAYNLINPKLGAAKADIWRYATLYTYGGFYIDEDSDMKNALDRVIQPTDSLIVAEDGTHYYNYFRPDFYLSDNMTFSKYKAYSPFVQRYITGNYSNTGYPKFFHGMVSITSNHYSFHSPINHYFPLTSIIISWSTGTVPHKLGDFYGA
jgi:mannosyltransferase OCH1-like enzyme